ncbi:Qat anti-phage system associated protein QatB [Flavobacterium ginsenosidimutans]|uniref:Qat anti-phage system associated protein QatB n=1 Tax=Flavobacterium ginsenosidimutans TaxID=687844 RepID=A0ABZ2Q9K7_9FLAO
MGTSSMYNGYSDGNGQRNPLLPDDFDDSVGNNNDGDKNPENDQGNQGNGKPIDKKWENTKRNFSKLASGTSKNTRGAVSTYIKAYGGSKSAAKNAVSGIRTTVGLGNFLSNASTQGFKESLENLKIEYKNRSTSEVLNDLINYLAPNPITKEDSIARKALIVTMEKLYELIENDNINIESIDKLDEGTVKQIIPLYVESYIYERLLNDLGSRIEANSLNSANAVKLEKELKEYINSKVEITFLGIDMTNSEFSKKQVESLYNQCYKVMEDLK